MSGLRSLITLSPARISAGYFGFGFCWLPLTDAAIAALVPSQEMPTALGLAKGWTFIGISTVLIFSLASLHQQQMRSAQQQLETTNQQLQVLHRVFRHNIRNDLNVIQGYTQTAARSTSDDRLQEQLQIVAETADDLVGISEKLKVIDQVDPANSNPDPVDLEAITENEVANITEQFPAVDICVESTGRTTIRADESIRFAIKEAIENGIIHFDGETEKCEVTIAIENTGDVLELTVEDNGPGIPGEELRAIRSQEESPLLHTSSIGLWLVIWLTRLNNGRVSFESTDASGSTVTFEFPQSEERQLAVPEVESGLLPAVASTD